jgi:carboxyl-terminal processing protease
MFRTMNKSLKNLLLTSLLVVLISGISSAQIRRDDPNAGINKYNTLIQYIKFAYVDTVNESQLIDKAIEATLNDLDPHSAYIPKKDVIKANEDLVGNFEGIGVQFEILHDTITIDHPVVGGPSEQLGILSGDKIIKIEGENVTGKNITNQFVFSHLRGKKGTKVTISIFRKGNKDLIDYTITRDKIPINSIDAAYMIAPGVGYIYLTRFAQGSSQEFDDAVERLKKEGMNSLILDLRNNGGGYLGTAVDLADEFLAPGKLIVYTEGRTSPREDYNATTRGYFKHGKLVIMINENSASASEIVSGAVQDWDRGVILGRRSFGKGLVQRPFMLPDSSQVRLTTARYHTPSGRCIQKPYSEGVDKYYEDLSLRLKHGELLNPDSIKFPDSLKYYTSQHRTVYGGGGIMPDVFTPWDSTPFTTYYRDLLRKDVIRTCIGDYVDKNRNRLVKDYPDFDSYNKNFIIDDTFMKSFFDLADQKGVKKNDKEYAISESLIKANLKALIAQKLWTLNDFYKVINQSDKEVQKAVEVITNDALFKKLRLTD